MAKKFFESYIDKVLDFPFWVKEILYIKLREDFEKRFVSEDDLQSSSEESYQLFKPVLSFIGDKELSLRENGEDINVYRFLEMAKEECSVAEITLKNFWTLEQTAKVHVYAMQKEYIKQPVSAKITAMALYMSSKIKIGDYLKRIGKITIDQLDMTLRRQHELDKEDKHIPFARILVSLGIISEKETKAVLYIKEESKKRFIFDANMFGKNKSVDNEPTGIKAVTENSPEKSDLKDNSKQLANLRKEIYDLQTKLQDIAKIIKR